MRSESWSGRLDIQRRQIYEVVLVGNTTMRDLAFGLNVQSIGVKPYKSLVEIEYEAGERAGMVLESNAQAVGLRVCPKARVYGGPIIGCHVGADVAAALLAVGMDEQEEPVMLVDIGTNTEVVIGNRHGMVAASYPAGPAFEGGEVTYGMPGYDGAVESVRIHDGQVGVSTIGDAGHGGHLRLRPGGPAGGIARSRTYERAWRPVGRGQGFPVRPGAGNEPVPGGHQCPVPGQGRQLLRTVHHPAALRPAR